MGRDISHIKFEESRYVGFIVLHIRCSIIGKDYRLTIKESDWKKFLKGELVQDCFPYLNPGERDLIKLGYNTDVFDSIPE